MTRQPVTWVRAAVEPVSLDFWAAVTATSLDDGVLVGPDADPVVMAARGDAAMELEVDDVIATESALVRLGARRVDGGWSSPGGLTFAVVASSGASRRPPVIDTSPGAHSRLDQICLDIPLPAFELEAGFWSALSRWPRRPGNRPEFDYLDRPDDQPFRFLLQRVGDGGPVRAHLDLACDDVPAEVARHARLGTVVVRRHERWTTLRAPSGRAYCITSRDPWTGRRPT